MIVSFGDQRTGDLYNGEDTKAARRIPATLWSIVARKLDMINAARELRDLGSPPGNRPEKLKGSSSGFHSICVNDQYRIVFRWEAGNALNVKITDYH